MEVIYCLLLTYWVPKEQFSVQLAPPEVVSRGIVLGTGFVSLLNPRPKVHALSSRCLYLSDYFVRNFHYLVYSSVVLTSPYVTFVQTGPSPLSLASPSPQTPRIHPLSLSPDGFSWGFIVLWKKSVRNANYVTGS